MNFRDLHHTTIDLSFLYKIAMPLNQLTGNARALCVKNKLLTPSISLAASDVTVPALLLNTFLNCYEDYYCKKNLKF